MEQLATYVHRLFLEHTPPIMLPRMFVLEGVDGVGKSTLANSVLQQLASEGLPLTLVRAGQRNQIRLPAREIYSRTIENVVAAADGFADLSDLLVEIAEMDSLIYKLRIKAADDSEKSGLLVSDSWSYRRFCKFAVLAKSYKSSAPPWETIVDRLFHAYAPTFIASGGVHLIAAPEQTVGLKRGFTPWEVVPLKGDRTGRPEERFVRLASCTSQLLDVVAETHNWQVIRRQFPFPPDAGSSPEHNIVLREVRKWLSS